MRQIFGDFYLYQGKFFFLTKGGSKNKISFTKGGSIECPAGGGIRTLPFRREVTVPFPPPCPRVPIGLWRDNAGLHLPQHFSNAFYFLKKSMVSPRLTVHVRYSSTASWCQLVLGARANTDSPSEEQASGPPSIRPRHQRLPSTKPSAQGPPANGDRYIQIIK